MSEWTVRSTLLFRVDEVFARNFGKSAEVRGEEARFGVSRRSRRENR
jgi:hypothetical protein